LRTGNTTARLTEKQPHPDRTRAIPLCVLGDCIVRFLKAFWQNSRAATAIEYGLIAALIAIAAIGAMSTLGTKLKNTFSNISNNMRAS